MSYHVASHGLPIYFIPMLDDEDRNQKYEEAIRKAIQCFKTEQGRAPNVVDLGCGTGMLSIFALRHGAAKVTSVDKNKDMVLMCLEAVRQAREYEGNEWGVHEAFTGTFPSGERLTRSSLWLKSANGSPRRFDMIVSEILGTLATSESMWTFVNQARPFLNVFEDSKVYAIPQSTQVTAAFYEMKELFSSESSGHNFALQVALDSGVFGFWRGRSMLLAPKSDPSMSSPKYIPTGEVGLPLYDMGFHRTTNTVNLSQEDYTCDPFQHHNPERNELLYLKYTKGHCPNAKSFLVLEWSANLWGEEVTLHNTLESYRDLSSRNASTRSANWGLFCSRPWHSSHPKISSIGLQVQKWEAGVPYIKLSDASLMTKPKTHNKIVKNAQNVETKKKGIQRTSSKRRTSRRNKTITRAPKSTQRELISDSGANVEMKKESEQDKIIMVSKNVEKSTNSSTSEPQTPRKLRRTRREAKRNRKLKMKF
eukprot:jgi/Bigna1/83626/fgenesh1_pg.111_\